MISPPRSPGAGSQTSSVVCRGQKFGPISSIKPSRALYCGAQPGSQVCTVSQRSSPHQTCQDTSDASRISQMMSDEPFIFFSISYPFSSSFCFPHINGTSSGLSELPGQTHSRVLASWSYSEFPAQRKTISTRILCWPTCPSRAIKTRIVKEQYYFKNTAQPLIWNSAKNGPVKHY